VPKKKSSKRDDEDVKALWALFLLGQLVSAGNMNYQQEAGYHEINPIYGEHPSKERVYLTKAGEIAGLYTLTKLLPEHKEKILSFANMVNWGFIFDDRRKGIAFEFRW
jgi:hypothetical protein